MTKHHFVPKVYHHTLGQHEPVLHIQDGDSIATTLLDARGGDDANVTKAARGNPVIGPFYVEGAEPGDTIAIKFNSIMANRDSGFTGAVLSTSVVDPNFVKCLPTKDRVFWSIDHNAGTASLIEPMPVLGNITLPLAPFLGCFGVAPASGQSISTGTSGPYGGNMDYRGLVAGVTIYFPVFAKGALLYFGDGHALQGDGEIVGMGLEVSMDIDITIDLHKGKKINWPRGESDSHIFAIGNARPLDRALQLATTEMVQLLKSDYDIDTLEASILLGQCVEYDVGNVFNPAYTVACKINKSFLPESRRANTIN